MNVRLRKTESFTVHLPGVEECPADGTVLAGRLELPGVLAVVGATLMGRTERKQL